MSTSKDIIGDIVKDPFALTEKRKYPAFDKGFSALELIIIIVILCAFFLAAGVVLKITSKSAYDITAKHDLKAFADYQDFYYKLNHRCLGEVGQSLRNDGVPSDLIVENYSVSEGICITIVSGSAEEPEDIDNPFILQAKHEKSDTVFEYNFQTGKLTER